MESVTTITSYGLETMKEQKRLIKIREKNNLVTEVETGVDSYATFQDGGSEPAHYMKESTERKK